MENKNLEKRLNTDASAGLDLKERGNHFYKNSNFPSAVGSYEGAIKLLESSGQVETNADVKNAVVSCSLNLALIYIKQKEFKLAMEISDEALKIDPDSVKAYYRRGQAHNGLDLRGEAIKDFEVVLDKQPSNKEAKIA